MAGILGGLGAGAAAIPVWVSGVGLDQIGSARPDSATGTVASGMVMPAALSLAAAMLAGMLARGLVRRLCGALAAGCGVLVVVAAVRVITDPTQALATATTSSVQVQQAGLTPWPWAAILCALLGTAAGALMAFASWQEPTTRYERSSPTASRPMSQWEQLSAGEDPTV